MASPATRSANQPCDACRCPARCRPGEPEPYRGIQRAEARLQGEKAAPLTATVMVPGWPKICHRVAATDPSSC